VLVYDAAHDQIHLLDETTAVVAEALEQGASAEMIAARLDTHGKIAAGEDLLALALDELEQANLTERESGAREALPELTRREMLGRFAAIGAAVLVPAIVSLTPGTASAQATTLACGAPCVATTQCPGTTRPTCHCCKIGGNTAGTCSTELSGKCQDP
jgi:hypothetical protein